MSCFVRAARILALVAVSCCAPARADGPPAIEGHGSEKLPQHAAAVASRYKPERRALPKLAALIPGRIDLDPERTTPLSEPFGLQLTNAVPNELSEKWAELQSRILSERETLAACRFGNDNCPAAARQFLSIVELGRQHQGRAQLGAINRAVNLSIRPASDWAQYGVDDFWSAPLATLRLGVGDCEDYAIVKYVALRESGIVSNDLRLVIVRDTRRRAVHAVVAVRLDDEWLLLDNRTLIMVNAMEARHYYPLFVLDHRGMREFGAAAFRR